MNANSTKYRLIATIVGRQNRLTDGKAKRQNHQQSGLVTK
jgi:hypothetical protein